MDKLAAGRWTVRRAPGGTLIYMPIYEFLCDHCEVRFEELVRNGDRPRCPECSTNDVRRLLSSFAVHSTSANVGGGGASKSCSSCAGSSCGTCH